MQLAYTLCVLLVAHALTPFSVTGARLGEACQWNGHDCKVHDKIACRLQAGTRNDYRCSCIRGTVQNRTLEYIKQDCVSPVTKAKGHGVACSWGECLDPFVCKGGTCACNADVPTYNAQEQECEKSTHGGPCLNINEHIDEAAEHDFLFTDHFRGCKDDGLTCEDGVCTCAERNPHWHEGSGTCEMGYHGDDCTRNEDCHLGVYDDEQYLKCVAKKCACQVPAYPDWNVQARTCDGLSRGDACTDSGNPKCTPNRHLECQGGQCTCIPELPRLDPVTKSCERKFRYNEPCTSDECEHELLSCIESKCSCRNASQEFVKGSECRTRSKKAPGGVCTSSDGCMVERNVGCSTESNYLGNHECGCRRGELYSSEHFCRPAELYVSCSNSAVCEPTGSECRRGGCYCPAGKVMSPMSQTCKLGGGQDCFENDAPKHDACASGACLGEDTNTPELIKKCACAAFGAIEHVWSSEKGEGCVPNYNHLPCDPDQGNADCRPSSFKNGRAGLVCVEHDLTWTCECSDPFHVFFQGYCVQADRAHGDDCESVQGPVCKLDPDLNLVCSPSTRKCECQPRVMTSVTPSGHTVYAYFPSQWSETLNRCIATEDMTPPGEHCSADSECQSGQCKSVGGTSMCSEMELPRAKGAGIQSNLKLFLYAAFLRVASYF